MVKDLQGAKRTTKIAFVAVETRQAAILVGALVAAAVFSYYLSPILGIGTDRAALLIAPLFPVALLFAFYRSRDGYHLDFVLERKLTTFMRPDVFFKRPRDRVNGGWRSVRDAVQRMIPAEEFHWEMLRCDDGTYLVAFRVVPRNLSLIGDTERMRVFRAQTDLYNALDFPFVEITRSKEGSTGRYTRRFRNTVAGTIPPEWRKLKAHARAHAEYLEETLPLYSLFERRGYVILPYNPQAERAKAAGGAGPVDAIFSLFGLGGSKKPKRARASKRDVRRRQQEAEAAYRVLSTRAHSLYNAMNRMGCKITALTNVEFVTWMKGQLSDWDEDAGEAPRLYEGVSLEPGGYAEIPAERLEQLIMEAEAVREEAPPALGIGDIVADKVAPDCVKVFPEYLKVDGRYHATMLVSGWPDEVYFGMLADLNGIDGRVKVVKFVDPRPKAEAKRILGGRVAELRASRKTAADGNVNAEGERELAEFTFQQALDQVNSGAQRYLELSVLVHVEAGSEEDLHAMCQQVHDTLAAWRVESQLAREQAWEGLLSAGPFGRNYLAERYCNFGVLSRPAACLFSYGSRQIDHENGVFVGRDTRSNSVLTLDTRELVNPHGVIMGQSGAGKSFVIKCLSKRLAFFSHRQVVIDPEGNSRYVRAAKDLGGAYAVIAPGSKHKINPFDLHEDYMALDLLEDLFEDAEEDGTGEADEAAVEEAYAAARAAALEGKAQEITRMVSLMAASDAEDGATGAVGGLSGPEASCVERAVFEAYARTGILRDDPSTFDRPAPIFPDFWEVMRSYADSGDLVARTLLEKLWSWHSGSLSKIFDAPTNVDLRNKYLVFQISKVKDRQKAPVMHAILEFLNGILSNPNEPSDCWIDEGWALLAYPMSAEFAGTMYRSGRARDNAMWIASQAINEFIDSPQGNVILKLAATHMVFRHEHRMSAQATAKLYDLSDEETDELLSFGPGEGYLVVDGTRIPVEVLASEHEREVFNTDPRLEHRNKKRRRREAEAARRVEESGRVANDTGAPGREGALPKLPGGDDPMPIYAFAGDAGVEAAAAVVKLIAREARKERLYVLAVDACGGALAEKLGADEDAAAAPDPFLVRTNPDSDGLGGHIAPTSLSALKVVPAPENAHLPALALRQAAREVFDVCVVACGDGSTPYAEDWLAEADEVVGCSQGGGDAALAAAIAAEERRGKNGTILATFGGATANGPPAPPEGAGARRLFVLGLSASAGTRMDKGLRDLARALIAGIHHDGEDPERKGRRETAVQQAKEASARG
jgi:hypothetical protein